MLNPGQPYEAPLLKIEGPVAFKGPEPVQFETPPLVLDPATGKFGPIAIQPDLAHIPREREKVTGILYGRYTATGADTHAPVVLYPDGPAGDAGDAVDVIFVDQFYGDDNFAHGVFTPGVQSTSHDFQAGWWTGPIIQGGDDKYYTLG